METSVNRIEIPLNDNEVLKDRNGKTVHLGDKLSFEGIVAKVIWREEQGRFYLDFGNHNLFELVFYTWLHYDFEIINE